MNTSALLLSRVNCPCCKFPTLKRSADDEICGLCNWQDDGQDDESAHEVWGGPNSMYSLLDARSNFYKYRVIFEPEKDTRICADSPLTFETKGKLIKAFQEFAIASSSNKTEIATLIVQLESILDSELTREIREFEEKNRNNDSF
jgi:hypothetical protein